MNLCVEKIFKPTDVCLQTRGGNRFILLLNLIDGNINSVYKIVQLIQIKLKIALSLYEVSLKSLIDPNKILTVLISVCAYAGLLYSGRICK